jgi:hypothetical protein
LRLVYDGVFKFTDFVKFQYFIEESKDPVKISFLSNFYISKGIAPLDESYAVGTIHKDEIVFLWAI